MALVYSVGDKVVHPAHGAGVVKKVVKRTIAGEPRQYYLIDPLAYDDLQIMVAVDKVKLIGLRGASKRSEMKRTLRILERSPERVSTNYKERQQQISDKLSSAKLRRVAEAARDLAAFKREKQGRMGVTDNRLLRQAREAIAGELAIVEDMPFEEALARIDEGLMLNEDEESKE
jgi:CarD family transcriptional regulator